MRDLDQALDAAISAEERQLLKSIGEEPGFFGQTLSTFGGRTGWVNVILMLVQGVAFVAGAWAAFNFFAASDVLVALRWGLPSAVLLLMSLMIKLALWPTIQTDRVLRELKRMELLMAHRQAARRA